ncbi:hypothetical protein Acsp06_39610 [Actinomycetospora sp. NBRC 106375]|uniref:hypothetical protein n=1 Tax=Actinomycetospora sp. NBRC 106375 TaxID=3032207 RepID=UPI0024A25C18|nr:hypothetical protein [Actinomycetospora sp. NBRC 106375]GLZ47776.1 hypothetical protein Acsp06_39610 [Actinomycetospora sp. NBRC 106375]
MAGAPGPWWRRRCGPPLAWSRTSPTAARLARRRAARRDLNQQVLALADAHHVGELAAPVRPDPRTTLWWPALDTTHRLAHRVLAACWALDTTDAGALPADRAERLVAELDALARGRASDPSGADDFLEPEVDALRGSLPG